MKYYEEFIIKKDSLVLVDKIHTYINCIFLNDEVLRFDFKNDHIHGHLKKEYDAFYKSEANLTIKIEYVSSHEKRFDYELQRQDLNNIIYKRFEITQDKVYVYGMLNNILNEGLYSHYRSIHTFPIGRYYTRYKTLISLTIPEDIYINEMEERLENIQKYVDYTQKYNDSIYYVDIFPSLLFTPGNKHYDYILNELKDVLRYRKQEMNCIYFYNLKTCLEVIKVEFKEDKYDISMIMI